MRISDWSSDVCSSDLEAFTLLVEARNYLTEAQHRVPAALPPQDRLVASCETMRLTSRLVQVMAWLLVQKAVHAGEIEDTDVDDPKRRLGGHEICGGPGPWGDREGRGKGKGGSGRVRP